MNQLNLLISNLFLSYEYANFPAKAFSFFRNSSATIRKIKTTQNQLEGFQVFCCALDLCIQST